MAKYCPDCGSKIEDNFKFCPECGFNLLKIENPKEENVKEKANSQEEENNFKNILICENCGEENDPSNDVCSGCGIKLKNTKTTKKQELPKENKPGVNSPHKSKSKSNKKNLQKSSNVKSSAQTEARKKLNNIRTITIISVGLGIAVIILFLSGVFNSTEIPNDNQSFNQGQNSGVNLNNIQQINDLEAKLKSNPKDTASILQLAHLKNDSRMFEQAIVNYKEYLALVPNDPDARIDMGICYYNLQNYKTAIAEMEEALKYDPKHQIGYLDLGIVNLTAGNFEKSKEDLKKAVELDPNSEYGKKAEELLKSHENTNQMNGGK